MVFWAFIAGLMIGGTVGVLVAAFCFAAWRSDAVAEAASARHEAATPPALPPAQEVPAPPAFAGRGGSPREHVEDRSA